MAETLTCRLFLCLVTVLTGVLDGTSAQSNSQNVALNKPCNISTIHSGGGFSNPCGAANNGNTSTVYVDGNCIHTDLSDPHPEWTVHLGQDYVIHSITIYARGNEVRRMSDVNVTINNNVVKTLPMCIPSEQDNCGFTAGRFDMTVSPPVVGNTVTLKGPAHRGGGGGDSRHFLNICEVQVWAYVCTSGNYPSGDACVPCGQCAVGDCNNSTGHCSTDCDPGYTGLPFCQTECDRRHYGYNCSQHCSAGCDGETCDNVNGHCDNITCLPGYFQTPPCDTECDHRHFGYNCSENCSAGCDGETCDNMSGHCDVTTCLPGYFQKPRCNTECDRHHYGTNCSHHCSAGCEGQTCDGATGHCDVSTCRPGYLQSPRCDQECPDGTYGTNCSQPCGQGCDPPDSCNKTKGGCACLSASWEIGRCADCADGHYGDDCEQICGHCAHSEVCSKTDGRCPAACDGYYTPPYCKHLQDNTDDSVETEVVVGVAVAAAVLVIVVIVLLVLLRRRRARKRHPRSAVSEASCQPSRLSGDEADRGGAQPAAKPKVAVKPTVHGAKKGEDRVYWNISHPTSEDPEAAAPPSPGNTGPTSPALQDQGPVYSNIQGGTSRQPASPAEDGAPSRPEPREDEVPVEEDAYSHEDLYACYSTVTSLSLMDTFQKYLLDCLASTGRLLEEFNKFPKGMPQAHAVGSGPLNIKKNRFKYLCAYDKNRVILRRPAGDTDTDYINASWIKGYGNDKAYIATQGPRAHMVKDLWWMIWQEGATQVVMLTNLIEESKDKCSEYWPAPGNTATYGHVTVTSQEDSMRADFVVRTLVLQVNGSSGQQQRTVHQYHYFSWPDHGVPAATSLVNFWRYVTARAPTDAPPIIHCSAGVGRTGTYIALDIAIDRQSRGLDVNVCNIVSGLRNQRCIMVQSLAQYKFLHEVILEAYSSRDTRFPMDQLDVRFPSTIDPSKPNSSTDHEFKILEEMKQWAKPHHTTAELEENRDKNRDPSVLPDDDHVVYLDVQVRGRNQYINAVCMSTYTVNKGWLLTQLPLPHTTVDLWRLVEGCGVTTIVSLGGPDDEQTVKDFCWYWPRVAGESMTIGPFTVSAASGTSEDHLKIFFLTVTTEDTRRQVTLLQYTDWVGEVPGSTSGLLHLMDTLTDTIGTSPSPVILQCLDGSTRSGLLCTLYDVTARLKSDGEVDVLPTVRYVHTVLPTAVASQTQYRYCYKVVQEVKNSLNVYANT